MKVDFSYKKNARRVFYDIEVLHDIFSILFMTDGHVRFTIAHTGDYDHIADDRITEAFTEHFMDREDVIGVVGSDASFELERYSTDRDVSGLRTTLDTIISCSSLWNGDQFTEYCGWNSANYDLPMICAARLLMSDRTFDPGQLRTVSNALVTFDGNPWEQFAHVEKASSRLVTQKALTTRLNMAAYADGHIDLASLARIVDSDDGGSQSLFPPGLKKEMARFGMDIVIDEAVSSSHRRSLSDQEFLDLALYNGNDVVGTAVVSHNRVITGQLATRDAVREMYPYTSARAVPLSKVTQWNIPGRDATAAKIASLVLIGENRAKPLDDSTINYRFPTPRGETDLLEYMREIEPFVPDHMYQYFDHFRGKDTSTGWDFLHVKKSQPVTKSAQMNVPYYRHGRPTDSYIRFSTGGAHGSVMAGLSALDDEAVDQWIRADVGAKDDQKPTLDLDDVIHVDWSSFYPTMASKMKIYQTRDGVDRYTSIIDSRIEIKESLPALRSEWSEADHARNQRQDGLKFLLNSATGAGNMRRKYALLPVDNRTQSMRLIGNMHIWCMAQRFTHAGAFVVATNTDGIFVTNCSLDRAQEIVDGYVRDYDMGVEPEVISRFINRDTSNRVEFEKNSAGALVRSAVGGRLRHGQHMVWSDDSIGKNVQYPLVAAHAALEYMQDRDWLTRPYDRERMESIVYRLWETSEDSSAWYHIHAGTSARRMLVDGEPMGKVNRVVLTTEGSVLTGEQAAELSKADLLTVLREYRQRTEVSVLVDAAGELGYTTVRSLGDDDVVVSYQKDKDTGELSKTMDLSQFLSTGSEEFISGIKLGIDTSYGIVPLKFWKPTVLTGYPSNTGVLLNSKKSLREFDMNMIDVSAYVRWAESLLSGWKVTADLPEVGMVSVDDTVIPSEKKKPVTKYEKQVQKLHDVYDKMVEVLA